VRRVREELAREIRHICESLEDKRDE